MAERKKESFSPPAVGGSSLLVVFAVLCLTVFALLSLTTVRADVRLAEASAKAVSDYYAADCQAQEILARLRNGEEPEDLELSLSIAEYPGRIEYTYAYTVPISDTRNLEVEVLLSGADYTVLRWQAAPAQEWESDDMLELWDGIMF